MSSRSQTSRPQTLSAAIHAVWGALIVALLLTVLAPVAAQAAPPPANKSLIFYKPGTAVIGTLSNGIWTQKRTLTGPAWNGWTHIAVSRTTLLLYNTNTGQVRTGTFQNGVYTPVATRTLFAGADIVAASCNTAIFYERSTGFAQTYTLTGGRLGTTATAASLPPYLVAGTASCDTLAMSAEYTDPQGTVGLLENGRFTVRTQAAPYARLMTSTATSYVGLYFPFSPRSGVWGAALGGFTNRVGVADDFAPWTHLAGTADSVLFYNTTSGQAVQWVLRNGTRTVPSQTPIFSSGWQIIAGGK